MSTMHVDPSGAATGRSSLQPIRTDSAPPIRAASAGRRLAAFVIDLMLLLAGLLVSLAVGLQIASEEAETEVLLVWILVVGPLYFALYHALGGPEGGPDATPGQHELGLSVRDVLSSERLGLGRSLLRSYGGLVAGLFVVPLVADLSSIFASSDERTWHDRLFRSSAVYLPLPRTPASARPTAPAVFDEFTAGKSIWSRGRVVARRRARRIVVPTLVAYVGLVLIATVLIPLLVTDLTSDTTTDEFAPWAELAVLIFLSGVYWTQAVLVTAVEAVRTGERLSTVGVIRRSSQRANALTLALLLLTILLLLTPWTLFVLLWPVARLGLVVPVIVLEGTPALTAFGRSWQLTQGRAGRAFGLLIGGGTIVAAAIGITLSVAFGIVGTFVGDAGVAAYAIGAALALLVASVPVSAVLGMIGTAWCLLYYDASSDAAGR